MNITDSLQLLELAVPITRTSLKKAYRDALMVWHPDRFAGNTDLQKKAATKTCLINEAYSLLSKIPESGYPYRKSAGKPSSSSTTVGSAEADPRNVKTRAHGTQSKASPPRKQDGEEKTSSEQQVHRSAKFYPRSLLDRIALLVAGVALILLVTIIIHVWPKGGTLTLDEGHDSEDNVPKIAEGTVDPTVGNARIAGGQGSAAYQKGLELLKGEPDDNMEAVKLFEESAKLGHAEAQYQLGLAYTSGKGILGVSYYATGGRDAQAKKYMRMAAEQGHPKAQYLFGRDYYRGWGVPEDKSLGLNWLLKAAAQGELEAQVELGDHFYFGDGADADKKTAFNWYLKAAKGGCPEAQQKAGDAYNSGVGVDRDYGEAVKWYLLAAKQNNYESKIWLGVAFEKGEGVESDLVEAHKWYALAKAQRDFESDAERESAKQRPSILRPFSKAYISGRGDCLGLTGIEPKLTQTEIQESARRQREFLSSAPKSANSKLVAQKSPALPAINGADVLRGEKLIPKQESVEDQVETGDAYYFGRGVSQDKKEAVRWWIKAAERGDSGAQYNLGICYAKGEGVPESINEAARWYELAASQGHSEAQHQLAVCYGTGNGVAKDLVEAARLSLLSAKQGNIGAQLNLGNCYNDGIGVEPDAQEAAKWYRLAAEQGNAEAQFYLGLAYGGGVGVPEDDVEAYKWYLLAANQDHKSAKKLLTEYEASPAQVAAAKQRVAEFEQSLAAKRAEKITANSRSKTRSKKAKDTLPPIVEASELRHLPSDSRLSSGTVLVDKLASRNGLGKLTLVNGLS